MRRFLVATLMLLSVDAGLAASQKVVGDWFVSGDEDRFGDGGTFVAMTVNGGVGLAVRCIRKQLSIGVLELGPDPKPLNLGDLFSVKLRTDKKPVVDTAGQAINERLIQVEATAEAVRTIRDGRETAVRLETTRGVTSTFVFPTRRGREAFVDIVKECPLD